MRGSATTMMHMARFTCGSLIPILRVQQKRCRQVSCRICWLQSLEDMKWTSFLFASPSIWTTISPAFFLLVRIGTLLTSSHTRLVSTYGWQSEVSSCDLQLILSHCLLGWLIVRPYGNFSFFLCGRPTCPMQYCPLFPGCCKKGDASQEPEIRPTNPCSSPRCNQGAARIRLEGLKLKIQNTISASQLEG